MARSLEQTVGCLVKASRTTRLVGAGIGARRSLDSKVEPRLTLLLNGPVPKETLVADVKAVTATATAADFDVLDVGDVKALGR